MQHALCLQRLHGDVALQLSVACTAVQQAVFHPTTDTLERWI